MNKADLKKMVRNGQKKNQMMPLADLEQLKKLAKVSLEIDSESNEYYYRVAIDDLIDKEFEYRILTDNGWELSLDEEFLFLYL